MNELLARAVNAKSMEWEENHESQVDRVAAMAGGSHLGSYLLRIREGAQPEWAHRAMLILARRIIKCHHISRSIAEKISAQALVEWAYPHCPDCGGAREVMGEHIRILCPSCNGAGIRRWTDAERREYIGAWGGRIERGLSFAMRDITVATGEMVYAAKVRLER